MAAYRRQQELAWIESLVEDIEAALEATGVLGLARAVPATCFLDLVGYTRLTEEQGDQAAAALAVSPGAAGRPSRARARRGAGEVARRRVMFRLPGAGGGGASGAGVGGTVPEAGLPPAHVGVAAGPVVVQGGDYFGRTVNLAARIAAYASASRVLVSEPVVQRAPPQGVTFVELGLVQLEGIAHPVRLLEAC